MGMWNPDHAGSGDCSSGDGIYNQTCGAGATDDAADGDMYRGVRGGCAGVYSKAEV